MNEPPTHGLRRWRRAGAGLPGALLAAVLAAGVAAGAGAGAAEALDAATEIEPLVAELSSRHGLEASRVTDILKRARILPEVLAAISRPAELKPWRDYRPIFYTQARIDAGVRFWREFDPDLARAESRFGVPPAIIVAIIGVETYYGKRAGRLRVLDCLATLAFRYPRRAAFFRRELIQFLLLTDDEGLDPLSVRGSYAGAIGLAQFISSSYRNYAVDFDDDGRRNLLESRADAIGSVANYLHRHGWRRGEPIAFPAGVSGDKHTELLEKGLKPHTTLGT